jgi:hypothetical protein
MQARSAVLRNVVARKFHRIFMEDASKNEAQQTNIPGVEIKKAKPARSEGEHVLGANRAGGETIFAC